MIEKTGKPIADNELARQQALLKAHRARFSGSGAFCFLQNLKLTFCMSVCPIARRSHNPVVPSHNPIGLWHNPIVLLHNPD